jgi:hypothetical protein
VQPSGHLYYQDLALKLGVAVSSAAGSVERADGCVQVDY